MFMRYLPEGDIEELTLILNRELFDENAEIFKHGEVIDKIYILASGSIELYLNISEGELYLDTLTETGCVMN